METSRVCPLCNRAVKILKNGCYARHGHPHGAGIGGGGCAAWRGHLTSDREIIEAEIARIEKSLPGLSSAGFEFSPRRIAERKLEGLRAKLAAR
jgi:hypothetical protein